MFEENFNLKYKTIKEVKDIQNGFVFIVSNNNENN